jgi:hypothetical protein
MSTRAYPAHNPYTSKHRKVISVTSALLTSTRRVLAPLTRRRFATDRQGSRYAPVIHLPPAYAFLTEMYIPEVRLVTYPTPATGFFRSARPMALPPTSLTHAPSRRRRSRFRLTNTDERADEPVDEDAHAHGGGDFDDSTNGSHATIHVDPTGSRFTRYMIYPFNKPLPPLPQGDRRDAERKARRRNRIVMELSTSEGSSNHRPLPPTPPSTATRRPLPRPPRLARPSSSMGAYNNPAPNLCPLPFMPPPYEGPAINDGQAYPKPYDTYVPSWRQFQPRRTRTRRYVSRFFGVFRRSGRWITLRRYAKRHESEDFDDFVIPRVSPYRSEPMPFPVLDRYGNLMA